MISLIAVVIYFVAGARFRHLAIGGLIALVFAGFTLATQDHIGERVSAFMGTTENCEESYCWQTRQANIAIGSGGFWGRGITQGIQKSYWLPQAVDDFIFAASAEELGSLRTAGLVLLYSVIAYRGFKIAGHAPNKFSMLLAAGISTWISAQAFVNIMVNTASLPIRESPALYELRRVFHGDDSVAVGVLSTFLNTPLCMIYPRGTAGHVIPNIAIRDAIPVTRRCVSPTLAPTPGGGSFMEAAGFL